MRWVRLRRYLLWVSLSLGLPVIFVTTAVRLQQYVLWRHAGQIHLEFQSLEIGKATLADFRRGYVGLKPVFNWPVRCASNSDNCVVAEKETYNFAYAHLGFIGRHPKLSRVLLRMYNLVGGRPARVVASVEIMNGVVSSKDYVITAEVLPHEANKTSAGESYGYMLIGSSTVARDLLPEFGARSRHMNYWIGWPSGCEGCRAIEVRFRNDVAPDEFEQVGKFDFSCLTRWLKPCRDKADIMPNAWAQAVKDGVT